MIVEDNVIDLLSKAINKNRQFYDKDIVCYKNQIYIFFKQNILNNNVVDIVLDENFLFYQIEIKICNNSEIVLNDKSEKRNFISFKIRYKYEKEDICKSYYICEKDKKYQLYEQKDIGKKVFSKEYLELDEKFFDDILKLIINKGKELKLIKEIKGTNILDFCM